MKYFYYVANFTGFRSEGYDHATDSIKEKRIHATTCGVFSTEGEFSVAGIKKVTVKVQNLLENRPVDIVVTFFKEVTLEFAKQLQEEHEDEIR